MQLLTREMEPGSLGSDCAELLMELAPLVLRSMRGEIRRQHADLSVPQFRALAFLSRHEGASLSDAAAPLGLTLPAASRLIEGLVEHRLVTRVLTTADRRRVELTLTPVGRAVLEEARSATHARLVE